ncbi:MAG: hypothetical protein WCJ54_05985 [Actinomycetota bacterium]
MKKRSIIDSMKQKYTFENLEDAKKANNLFAWTQEYLYGPGHNKNLAKHLLEAKNTIFSLRELDIDSLICVAGPDKGFKFPIDPKKYEITVSEYSKKIQTGWNPPPLIVTTGIFEEAGASVADGTHRLEALKRCDFHKYWTIFVEKK